MKVYHEILHFTKQKSLSTGWIVVLTPLQGSHQVMKVYFFLKINPTVLSSTEIFILSSFPGEFLLTYCRVFRSEAWLAFKNRGLKFGERESSGSCGEEKHFGTWRWIKVSQQGAAADLLPLIIPEPFWGGHLLQLQLSHWWTWINTASGTGGLPGWNGSKKHKFWCNQNTCLFTLEIFVGAATINGFSLGIIPFYRQRLKWWRNSLDNYKVSEILLSNKSEILRIVLKLSCVGDAV